MEWEMSSFVISVVGPRQTGKTTWIDTLCDQNELSLKTNCGPILFRVKEEQTVRDDPVDGIIVFGNAWSGLSGIRMERACRLRVPVCAVSPQLDPTHILEMDIPFFNVSHYPYLPWLWLARRLTNNRALVCV